MCLQVCACAGSTAKSLLEDAIPHRRLHACSKVESVCHSVSMQSGVDNDLGSGSMDDRARTTDMAKINRKTEGSSGTGSPSSVSDSQSSWQLMLSNSRSESASVPFASFDRSHLTAPALPPAITAPWLTAPAAEGERAAALDKPSCAGRRTGCGGPTCVADGSRSGTEVGVCTCARACPSVRPASLAASFDDLCSLAAGLDTRAVKMPSGIWLR